MLAWAKSPTAAPKPKLGIAMSYLPNQRDALLVYLWRIELSKNRAKRSIKPFMISRKNSLFANTQSYAQSSAILFIFIMTAKANELDTYRQGTEESAEALYRRQ